MKLKDAEKLAYEFIKEISDFCKKIRVVGSIRRKKSEVRDIDLVLIVSDYLSFTTKLRKISSKIIIDGEQVKRVIYRGAQFDLYFADHKNYEGLILIRTGSAAHNIKLSRMALSKGMKLSHRGLEQKGKFLSI